MRSSVLYHMISKYHGVPEELKSLIFHNRFRFMLVPFLLYGYSIFLAYLPLEWLPPNCAFTYIFSEPAYHIHLPHDSQSHQPFQTTCSCYYFVYHLSFFLTAFGLTDHYKSLSCALFSDSHVLTNSTDHQSLFLRVSNKLSM